MVMRLKIKDGLRVFCFCQMVLVMFFSMIYPCHCRYIFSIDIQDHLKKIHNPYLKTPVTLKPKIDCDVTVCVGKHVLKIRAKSERLW